jgi:hypothetical protein
LLSLQEMFSHRPSSSIGLCGGGRRGRCGGAVITETFRSLGHVSFFIWRTRVPRIKAGFQASLLLCLSLCFLEAVTELWVRFGMLAVTVGITSANPRMVVDFVTVVLCR